MNAPDLCDGCMAQRAWCVCGVVASMRPIPATGWGTIRRRGAHVAPPPPCVAVQDLDPDAGHDPGDEHRDGRAEWTRATMARWSRTLEILGRGPDDEHDVPDESVHAAAEATACIEAIDWRDPCRCGHTGADPHPCHARAYTCRQPATRRFYAPRWVALAGVQTKAEVSETWACDACWSEYQQTVTEPT